jgi:RNA polymerase sigma-70 factor (ECF subfamily)
VQIQNAASDTPLVRLFLDKRSALLRFFTARTGSADLAEDLVQELYLKARASRAENIADPLAYLYRLGLNLLTDRYRSTARGRRRDDEYWRARAVGAAVDEDDAPSPERAAEGRLRLERILRAVDSLPPQCQRVFRLHRIEGLSHQEVAQNLGISKSTVEKHMIAAIRHLAEHVK